MSGKISGAIKAYADGDPLRLHTPGHKGGLCKYDVTELADGSFPGGSIAEAQKYIAGVYGAKRSYLLAGGSSQGVKAAIYFANADGIADVNSHRSVFDGFKLSGKNVISVGRRGDVTPITAEEIRASLTPEVGAVVVTSPTYFGYCADIDGIAELCRCEGLLFVIDGAHGAHFGFGDHLPPAFASKCDICNVSAHKTLGALTQSAILLDNLDDAEPLAAAVELMGTTSPSYLLYSSIEESVIAAEQSSDRYAELYAAITDIKRGLPFLKNDDFTRLVLDCAALDIRSDRLCSALCRRGVYAELVTERYIVFLFTAADRAADVARFDRALRESISELR